VPDADNDDNNEEQSNDMDTDQSSVVQAETTGVDAELETEPAEIAGVDAALAQTTGVDEDTLVDTGMNNDDDDTQHDDDDTQPEQPDNLEMHNEDDNSNEMDSRYGAHSLRYNLRARRERDYLHLKTHSYLHTTVGNSSKSLTTPQMSMKQGLRMFGEAGVQAVQAEMQQLHDRNTIKPVHTQDLMPEAKREALAYLMFLK
jgi:hypothetical protein